MSRAARKGLGRGLASLIPDDTFEGGAPKMQLRMVPVESIRPNPEQPRTAFDEAEIAALAQSIREHGVMSPLVCRKQDGVYYLIAGERRLRASTRAGLTEVPVVLMEASRPAAQLELALVENLLRSDLDPVEAARGYARLCEEYGYTQAEVARKLGRDRSTVANAIRLLGLRDFVLDAVVEGHLSAGHARTLLPVGDPVDLRVLLGKIVDEGLSVRATERLVRRYLEGTGERAATTKELQGTVRHANRLLTRTLSTQVAIKPRKDGGGRIVIAYSDRKQLDALVDRLGKA